jgi:hypothetical protein
VALTNFNNNELTVAQNTLEKLYTLTDWPTVQNSNARGVFYSYGKDIVTRTSSNYVLICNKHTAPVYIFLHPPTCNLYFFLQLSPIQYIPLHGHCVYTIVPSSSDQQLWSLAIGIFTSSEYSSPTPRKRQGFRSQPYPTPIRHCSAVFGLNISALVSHRSPFTTGRADPLRTLAWLLYGAFVSALSHFHLCRLTERIILRTSCHFPAGAAASGFSRCQTRLTSILTQRIGRSIFRQASLLVSIDPPLRVQMVTVPSQPIAACALNT